METLAEIRRKERNKEKILDLVGRYKLVGPKLIARALDVSLGVVRTRLYELRKGRRLRQQRADFHPDEWLYGLKVEAKVKHEKHTYSIAEAMIEMELELEKAGFGFEDSHVGTVAVDGKTVEPDWSFLVKSGAEGRFYFLEMETGSRRDPDEQKERMRTYFNWLTEGETDGIQDCRFLYAGADETHQERLLRYCRYADRQGKGLRKFWFTTMKEMVEDPLGTIWVTTEGKRESLV